MFARLSYPIICAAFAFTWAVSDNVYAEPISSNYTLVETLHLPGATRWDILTFDPQAHRLFITRGESVEVLDVVTKKVVGTIPHTSGVHAVALVPELGQGFISNGAANTVTVFDLTTLQSLATLPTGIKPDVVVYDASTQRIFVANGGSSDMTVLDAKGRTVVDTIKLNGKPEFAVTDGSGRLYVNLEDKSQLAVVDITNLKVLTQYDLAPSCTGPTGLAIDTRQHRLFATCGNKAMVVVHADTGKLLDTLPIGAQSDGAVFDPNTQLAFSSNGEGTVTVVGAAGATQYKVVQIVSTIPTARTMALNPITHQLYLAAAETEGFDPPNEQHPYPRPHIKPDTFMILTVGQRTQALSGP